MFAEQLHVLWDYRVRCTVTIPYAPRLGYNVLIFSRLSALNGSGRKRQHRLAAIMATDVVGYSSLIQSDEAGTLAALDTIRTAIEDQICAGRYDEAVTWAERSLRDKPNYASALRILIASHALAGRLIEGQKAMARLRQSDPGLRVSTLGDVMPPFRRPEDRDKYVEGLRLAGLPE